MEVGVDMELSVNFVLIGLAVMGCFSYLFLLTRSIVRLIKFKKKSYLFHVICLKGIPFIGFAFLFSKRCSLISLMSLTLGISLGVCVFVGFILKRGRV